MLRTLESSERAHTLLAGPPASARSLFMLEIQRMIPSNAYFAEGAATTKAGLQKFVAENSDKEIIIWMGLTNADTASRRSTNCDGWGRVHNY